MSNNDIITFEDNNGSIRINVKLKNDTVWLSLNQLSELFERDKSVISRHIKNIFAEDELAKNPTVAFFATVQYEGEREVIRQIEYYNLDMIISVGYRVNSKRGTAFRKWASDILKQYLIEGYNINNQVITSDKINKLKSSIELLSTTLCNQSLINDIGIEIINIIKEYARTWDILLKYDENQLKLGGVQNKQQFILSFDDCRNAINSLKEELYGRETSLFGQERSNALESIIGNLEQTFDGIDLYQTNAEKAANLLYLVIKDHPFADGNKRIGCLLFLLYLKSCGINLKIINDNGLIALALLVAESAPLQKDLIIELIVNLLNEK
jgi:prophage maintenance system killer protein